MTKNDYELIVLILLIIGVFCIPGKKAEEPPKQENQTNVSCGCSTCLNERKTLDSDFIFIEKK